MNIINAVLGGAALAGGAYLAHNQYEERQVAVGVGALVKQAAPSESQLHGLVDSQITKKTIGVAVGAALVIGGAALLISEFSGD